MKTRMMLLLMFALLFAASAFAQDAMPTKEETVNYINKKLQEVKDRGSAGYRDIWTSISFKLNGNEVEFFAVEHSSLYYHRWYSFNPRDIEKTEFRYKPGEEMGEVVIWTVKGGVKVRDLDRYGNVAPRGRTYFSSGIIFRYLATVPGNKDKIHKAFLHLRDLAKAEDDLF